MRAAGDEIEEELSRVADLIRRGRADAIEAQRMCLFGERRLEIAGVRRGGGIQKSRSTEGREAGTPARHSLSSGRNDGRDFTRAYQFFAASSSTHGTSPR